MGRAVFWLAACGNTITSPVLPLCLALVPFQRRIGGKQEQEQDKEEDEHRFSTAS